MSYTVSRILVPTDFSPCSERALEVGLHLARRNGAEVMLLNITELTADYTYHPSFFAPDPRVASIEADHASKQALENTVSMLQTDGVTVKTASVRGLFAAEAICEYATHAKVDYVVIGTHGRRGIRRLALGSVAERVVRRAPCPVLTVRRDLPTVPKELRSRVLVPVDFSDFALKAVRTGTRLVRSSGGQLVLLHAVGREQLPLLYQNDPRTLIEREAEAQEKARERLGYIAEELTHGEVPVRLRVVSGTAARSIIDYANNHRVSLVCLSTHGRTGLHRFFLGSVAERVVRRAACPVLTVKSYNRAVDSNPAEHAA